MPGCPRTHRDKIVRRVSSRTWQDCTIGNAVGICSHNYIRHRLTDYETWLYRHKLERDEARLIVKEELDEIFQSWQKPGLNKR
ncbi:DUF2293 domain-containing protein [Roseibium sp.]|uniref:DUF2293 domain-containing protein n=1 Tax=Roseibium sp. TaxID=1936156 RepID=UPI003B50EB12